jgi:hypothetical protein
MTYKVWEVDGRTTPEDLVAWKAGICWDGLEYAGMDWKVWDGLGDVQERLSSLLSY